MTDTGDAAPGDLVDERFEILSVDHRDGMSLANAQDRQFDRPVRLWLLGRPDLIEHHEEVVRTLTSVQHPCLSPLHAVGLTDTATGPAVMVAFRGHCGPTLAAAHGGRPADAATTVEVFDQVAAAVGAVHARDQSLGDLNSGAVVADTDGSVYLLDPLVATIGHHGPQGAGPVHQQRDVGALVALVVELLTGRAVPGEDRTPRSLPRLGPDRPALTDLDRLLAEAVRPDRRPADPRELALEVRDALVSIL